MGANGPARTDLARGRAGLARVSRVLVMHAFGTSQEAHSFFENPELLQAMQEAGVEKAHDDPATATLSGRSANNSYLRRSQ